jgi:hypothetical protein
MAIRRIFIFLLLSVTALSALAPNARADYGWIPEYQKLNLKVGTDFLNTSQNYGPDGTVGTLTANGQSSSLNEFHVWTDAEYGIARDWAVRARLSYVSNSLSSDGTDLASGSGFGDVDLGVKWNFKSDYPILTLEVLVHIPTSSVPATSYDQLVTSDGNFDIGMFLHSGAKSGRFLFDLSPGVLGRFSGYSSAFTADGAVQLNFPRGYIRAFMNYIYSFQNVQPYDSTLDVHNAIGSGGSYALLNGSPTGLTAGGKIGIAPIDDFRIEGEIAHSLFGTQFPDFISFGVNIMITFDFYQPQKATRVREVPFEGEQPTNFPNQ